MRRIHHELGKVRHTIMYPFLAVIIIGIAFLIVYLQAPASHTQSVLQDWVNDPFQNQ